VIVAIVLWRLYVYVTGPQGCTCACNIASGWRVVINNHAMSLIPDLHSNFVDSISVTRSSIHSHEQNSIIALAVDFSRSLKLGPISRYNQPIVASALEIHA